MKRVYQLDYLRGILAMFVVWHHGFLPYTTGKYSALIIESGVSPFLSRIITYFDIFFMSAFFFVSGLFFYKSLVRRKDFLRRNLLRFSVYFIVGVYLINSVGYFYSIAFHYKFEPSIANYFTFMVESKLNFPGFQMWFIWVLVLFQVVGVVLYKLNVFEKEITKRPFIFLSVFVLVAYLVYSVMDGIYGSGFITLFGPFSFQASRLLMYFTFFIAGVYIGKGDIYTSLISKEKLSKYWVVFLVVGCFFAEMVILFITLSLWEYLALIRFMFVLSNSLLTFGFVGLAMSIKQRNVVLEFMGKFAIYIFIVHYSVVAVMQYYMFNSNLPVIWKGLIVGLFGYDISFGLSLLYNYIKSRITGKSLNEI